MILRLIIRVVNGIFKINLPASVQFGIILSCGMHVTFSAQKKKTNNLVRLNLT